MENYIQVSEINGAVVLIVKNKEVLEYIKKLLKDNFHFSFTEENDLLENSTKLILSKEISKDVFDRHFSVVTLDNLNKIVTSK